MTDISEFTNLYQEENEKLFEQGIWLAQHCVDKKSEAEIKAACGIECGASADTINKRLRVGRVFGDNYFVDCNWSLHVAACELAKANGKDEQTTEAAFDLMDTAIKGYVDKDGNHRPYSAATLKEHFSAANGNAKPSKPETVYKGEMVINHVDACGYYMEVEFDSVIIGKLKNGDVLTVTIARVPSPATATAESEVAA